MRMAKKLAIDVVYLESLGGMKYRWTPARCREIRLDLSKDKAVRIAQQSPGFRVGWFLRVYAGAKAECWLVHRTQEAPDQSFWLGNVVIRDEVRLLVKLLRELRS